MKGSSDIVAGAIRQKKIVYLILAVLIAVGIFGLGRINKDEFPTFEIKQGLVAGVYPGASASEVESQLTDQLEQILFSFPEVVRENTTSVSKDGICYIFVDVDVPPEKKAETWSKIRLKLDSNKPMLPPGVLAVAVLDEFSAVSSLLIALESEDKGWGEMKYYADELSRRLRTIPELANISVIGTQSEEVAVIIDQDRLSAYGINASSLMLDYQSSSLPVPGGFYMGSPVKVQSPITDEYEIAEKAVWTDPEGNVVRLKDIAKIERKYKEPSSYTSYNGNTALVLSVEMRPDNNIVAFGKDVDAVLAEFSSELPESVKMSRITDQPKVVERSVMSFLRDLLISMLVVIFVMLMLFPMRSALIASSGVPVCTAVTIAIMYLVGIPLNTVTLAALIVVLGMIVDDSIITMDGYMDKISKGLDTEKAAKSSARELFMPMFMATFAISAMFFPTKAIITGYLGDFINFFPWVIAIALAASLAYAMLVVPSLEVRFIGTRITEKENAFTRVQHKFFDFLQRIYDRAVEACFRHPMMTITGGVVAVCLGIFMFTRLNVQMMPMAARDMFAVELNLEGGSELDDTRMVADSLQKILLSDERVKSVTSFVGTGAPRFHATYPPQTPSVDFAQMIVNTRSEKATEELLAEYEGQYEHHFPNALIRFKQMDYQGVTPVVISFKGGSVEQMKPFADSLKAFMYGMPDMLKWVHSDCDKTISRIDVSLRPEEAARLGVNKALMSLSLAGTLSGQTVATLWEGNTKIPVNVYTDPAQEENGRYDRLENIMVPTSLPGVSVPLRQVADISPSWGQEAIPHSAGEESVTVSADLKMGVSQPAAMKEIDRYVQEKIVPVLPEGVEVSYKGLSGSNEHLIPEIGLSFICAVMVLFLFMLLHFKKISLSILTIVLSLLCLFGAFFGLWLFKVDFSMTAVLGLISLVGIIVRNGIIMFEYAEELHFEKGFSVREAALEAGKRRMRPIFLTSCTTALGVLPMIISGDLLWLPMGVVICFGTMMSIVLVVLIMPVSYWLVFRKNDSAGIAPSGLLKPIVVVLLALLPSVVSAQTPLSLSECRDMALRNDPYARNAALAVKAAKAQKQEAVAEYFPKVSLNAFGFWSIDPMLEIGIKEVLGESDFSNDLQNMLDKYAPQYGINSTFTAFKYGVSASVSVMQPLFAGGRIVTGNRLASLGVKASEIQQAIQLRTTEEEVEKNYWQVVALEEKLSTVKALDRLLDSLYKDVSVAVAAGVAMDTDLMQVSIKQKELQSGRSQLVNGIRLAKMNLFNKIGQDYCVIASLADSLKPHIDDIVLSDRLDDLKEPSAYYVPEEEMAASLSENQLLQMSVEAKQLEKRMTLGEALPQVGVGASYGYSHSLNSRFNGNVFAMVQIPISDWGKVSRKMQRQDYQLQMARNEQEYLSAQLILLIRQLWLNLESSWEQMMIARDAMDLAQKTADRLSDSYQAGMISLTELLQGQTQLRTAVEAYVEAQINYSSALTAYQLRK